MIYLSVWLTGKMINGERAEIESEGIEAKLHKFGTVHAPHQITPYSFLGVNFGGLRLNK
jgi:hypothetical protein